MKAYKAKARQGSSVNVRELPSITSKVLKKCSGLIGEIEGTTDPDNQGYKWYKIKTGGFVREDVVIRTVMSSSKLQVKVTRLQQDETQSLGVLTIFDPLSNEIVFTCKTLELPDKNNASNISCIPLGVYDCEMTYSNAFKKPLYLIKDVPNRAGVRIHSANYVTQLRGCIALGAYHKDINGDGTTDLTHSGNTMKEFESILNKEPFTLEIA